MTRDHSTKTRPFLLRDAAPADIQTAALALLKSGEATLSEAAELAGVSRQIVRHWAVRTGIDVAAARAAWLKSAWHKRLRKR